MIALKPPVGCVSGSAVRLSSVTPSASNARRKKVFSSPDTMPMKRPNRTLASNVSALASVAPSSVKKLSRKRETLGAPQAATVLTIPDHAQGGAAGCRGRRGLVSRADHHGRLAGQLGFLERFSAARHIGPRCPPCPRGSESLGRRQ